MKKKNSLTTNTTLLKLKGTPFRKASEMKAHEDQILMEEWQSVERARVRRELLMKDENRVVLSPLLNGFKAKFIGTNGTHENLVRVYLAPDDSIQVDIAHELKSRDVKGAMESLVRSLVEGLMGGYLAALGLKSDSLGSEASSQSRRKAPVMHKN